MDKRKTLKKIFRAFIFACFVTFMALYLSQAGGYTEYQNRKQVALTEKQIKEFEKDVAEGKQIDMKTYLKTNNYNYQNKISRLGLKISKTAGGSVKTLVEHTFKFLEKLAD